MATHSEEGLYIMLISAHGLIRGENLELGRDPDTGGQVTYVVELARALADDARVERVDLLTRQVIDKRVDPSYAQPVEPIAENANIIRIACGPRRYLRKERLWPYLDNFTDHTLGHIRTVGRTPDIVHGHYADAGYVGAQLARLLRVPFVFTGHSLGRVKKQRLLEKGRDADTLEGKFRFLERFEAEETALDTAALVVASTHQEVKEQYELYDHYQPERMEVIPPGVDLKRFRPPGEHAPKPRIAAEVERFLQVPERPVILAMARPDERKNFETLIRAYAEHPRLRTLANLVIVAGNREEIAKMDKGARHVLINILNLIDTYDLYGSVAYPKHHEPEDVPDLYRLAARSRGVFVNPALTEPFGLTLIEAAASGLPIVATNDGGPRDIIKTCQNGVLIDPLNAKAIGNALFEAVTNGEAWQRWAACGLEGAHRNYTWTGHADRYLTRIEAIVPATRPHTEAVVRPRASLSKVDRVIITDIDNTLTGDDRALGTFREFLAHAGAHMGFGVATGRNLDSALGAIQDLELPAPDILVTSVGTEIHYGEALTRDRSWQRQIDYHWRPDEIRRVLDALPGLHAQEPWAQERFKVSYTRDAEEAPSIRAIKRHLRQQGLRAKLVFSLGMFLDVVPIRAGDGLAIRHLGIKWGLPPERWLVVGDSGNDEEMLSGNTLGAVVGNYSPELEKLRKRPRIYFAEGPHAWGILEGIEHYNFTGDIRLPDEEVYEEGT
jgi:sucrose-phosphate synthase